MLIKTNKKIVYEDFLNLKNGQLFSINNLFDAEDPGIKKYFIKIKSDTIPNKLEPYDSIANYGYAVDLASGDFVVIKNDKIVILEKGNIMLED